MAHGAAPVLFFRVRGLRPALVLELFALYRSWRDCFASFDHCTPTIGHFTAPRPNFDKFTRIRCYLARLESPHKSLLQQGGTLTGISFRDHGTKGNIRRTIGEVVPQTPFPHLGSLFHRHCFFTPPPPFPAALACRDTCVPAAPAPPPEDSAWPGPAPISPRFSR